MAFYCYIAAMNGWDSVVLCVCLCVRKPKNPPEDITSSFLRNPAATELNYNSAPSEFIKKISPFFLLIITSKALFQLFLLFRPAAKVWYSLLLCFLGSRGASAAGARSRTSVAVGHHPLVTHGSKRCFSLFPILNQHFY